MFLWTLTSFLEKCKEVQLQYKGVVLIHLK